MLFELREYRCMPGRVDALLSRFEAHTLRIWDRLGIRVAGFYVPVIGEASDEVMYVLVWNSLAEREELWSRFLADEEWLRVKAETEAGSPLVATVRNRILKPAFREGTTGFEAPSFHERISRQSPEGADCAVPSEQRKRWLRWVTFR